MWAILFLIPICITIFGLIGIAKPAIIIKFSGLKELEEGEREEYNWFLVGPVRPALFRMFGIDRGPKEERAKKRGKFYVVTGLILLAFILLVNIGTRHVINNAIDDFRSGIYFKTDGFAIEHGTNWNTTFSGGILNPELIIELHFANRYDFEEIELEDTFSLVSNVLRGENLSRTGGFAALTNNLYYMYFDIADGTHGIARRAFVILDKDNQVVISFIAYSSHANIGRSDSTREILNVLKTIEIE